ncbi:MAG: membrane protein [Bdellovibrio sp. ArHS]|uniref:lipocalin family protein n=1 Tax=Bdellovibrio sp. ArHS TaxID=1569284 RepID=UPI00058312D1|nr:lipocalin family protein [Bdellovibrio sp. ArHS]KHD88101.1 MAG: membrane protein [Bdellovibrio sp. ArHS]
MRLVAVLILSLCVFAEAKPLPTARFVDLTRYQGLWHEIASIPQFFQRKCVKDTTAEYTLLSGEEVRVLNSCMTEKGEKISSEGRAKVIDTNTNAKLNVTFANIAGKYFYLLGGKYWVLHLDNNYQIAVIGHPTRDYGWILSRNSSISESTLKDLADFLEIRGYDTCKFLTTPQDGGMSEKKKLCEL